MKENKLLLIWASNDGYKIRMHGLKRRGQNFVNSESKTI